MAEPRLGPDELDRLEDALEGLEALEDLRDPSDAVSSRLADFQFILQASRDALPLEDVRPGLLDGVLSEARLSTADIPASVPEPPQTESFWARMRKAWLIPGLAVAGSAALVLILVRPMLDEEPAQESTGAVAINQDTTRAVEEALPSSAPASQLGQAEASMATEAVAGSAKSDAPPPPPPAAPATRGLGKRQAPAEVMPEPAPAPEPAPEPEPELEPPAKVPEAVVDDTKSSDAESGASEKGWNAIEQGDAAREGGDCFSARNHYARALDDGNDSVRARAYVGMGLCKQSDGNAAAADEYFDKARELDEDAVKFADTRAEEAPSKPSSRRPKKKASRKRKRSMDFDESMDPFK